MASRKLIVEIVGDDKSLHRAFNRSTTSATRFGSSMEKVQRKAGVFDKFSRGGAATFAGGAAAAGALRFLDQSVEAASALEEQINKSRVVLGSTSKTVEDFGKTSAEALGISNRAAVESASSFAGLFTTIGTGRQQAAAFGIQLTALAGDLSSFFNVGTDEALTALRSGLVGEAEPLRRFNVLLSEARVSQEAFTQTGKTSVQQLTEQDKVLARIAIIMRETADAQGDVTRTADSLANKQRRLNAEFEDTRARIGKLVLPLKVQLVGALTEATNVAEDLVGALEALSNVKIPTIVIPVVGEFGGGKAGDIAKMALGLLDPRDILIPVRIIRAVRRGGDKESPENAVKGIGAALEKSLAAAVKGFENVDRAAHGGEGFNVFVAALNKVISSTTAAIAKAEAHAAALTRLEQVADIAALAVDQVGLALQRSNVTPTLKDDIAAYQAIGAALQTQEKAILAQIAISKEDVSLKRELVSVQAQQIQNENSLKAAVAQRAQNQKDAARQAIKDAVELAAKQKDAEKAARQAAQFRALGLQATGEDLVPTAQNLRQRLGNITDAVKGTFLDTNKTRSLLQRIRRVLAGEFGAISQETRATIKGMLDDIKSQFDDTAKGPLTKTSGLNSKKIADALGLDPAKSSELRSLLSGFNTAGRALAGATASTFRPGAALGAGAGIGGMVVESHVTLQVNEDVLAKVVTRGQQKTRRRNPQQKRGPNRIGA